ncbi:uncharacterized protein LOC124281323 isoform X2 [Haliotis rubra]|uniref:uncharacterized protein LOC124281323 isoform X2 n=1 Tax=Haliotis rubra TaxID=36100 RepID=UPI001EE57032|nr:uncharacterized protein LOC124281323 isoform X2 [Haliotis rubra]
MKRPRLHDAAVPVKNLTVLKARYGTTPVVNNVSPDVDSYDPRAPEDRMPYTQEQKRDFGLQLSKLSPDVQALDILLCPEDLISMKTSDQKSITDLSIPSKAQCYASDNKDKLVNCESLDELETICDDFYSKLTYSEQECKDIAICTVGQSINDTWFEQRAGRLTASNFKQACSYAEYNSQPSMSFLKSIMCEDRSEAKDNCEPLMWGRKKEPVARHMYTRLVRSCHKSLKVHEPRLWSKLNLMKHFLAR